EGLMSSNVDRLQDDWFVGVDTLEKSERILASITAIYRDFGLEINGNKTTVDRVIALSQDLWISELSGFLSHKSGPISGTRLREFLSLSLKLQKQYAQEPVINYALAIIESQQPSTGDV